MRTRRGIILFLASLVLLAVAYATVIMLATIQMFTFRGFL